MRNSKNLFLLTAVFLFAFHLLTLENLFFRLFMYLRTYLDALGLVATALLGITLGGAWVYFIPLKGRAVAFAGAGSGLFSFAAFILSAAFPYPAFFSELFLFTAFLLGSVPIAWGFVRADSYRVYAADLFGAAGAFLAFYFFFPAVGIENYALLSLPLTALAGIFILLSEEGEKKIFALFLFFLAVLAALLYNQDRAWLDLRKIQSAHPSHESKIFNWKNCRSVFSRDSLIQRVDILDCGTPGSFVFYDGYPNDNFLFFHPSKHWDKDSRFPHRLIAPLIPSPKIFVMGTGAPGILTALAWFPNADFQGVEINPQIIELMTGPFFEKSHRLYENIEVHKEDGRSNLSKRNDRYDLLTLYNTHLQPHFGSWGQPEYLHTREALSLYLDRLTERGILIFEEKTRSGLADESFLKLVTTLKSADELKAKTSFNQRILIYGFTKSWAEYHVLIYSQKPWTADDLARFDEWLKFQRQRKRVRDIKIEYLPGRTADSRIEKIINEPVSPARLILDDRPFPNSLSEGKSRFVSLLLRLTGFSLGTVLVLLGLTLFLGKWPRPISIFQIVNLAAFFILTGLGYFFIETCLIQKLQLSIGSPSKAFVIVAGSLLFSSGLGSLAAGRIFRNAQGARKNLISVFVLLVALIFLLAWIQKPPVWPFIVLLGFMMGIPFPWMMNKIQKEQAQGLTALFYGLNAAASAMAIPLCLGLAVQHGFGSTWVWSAGFYALAGCSALLCRR